jgi:signal-transduction protein with cAMP-binding, CBS, and nucleotidyltransferase domain
VCRRLTFFACIFAQFRHEHLWNRGMMLAPQEALMELSESVRPILEQKGGLICSVSPSDTVYAAIAMMAEKKVGALLVIFDDKIMGIVSERDYARKVILKGRSSKETTVAEIMSSPVIAISPSHTVGDCMKIITDHRIRHLPVLDQDRLVGLISIGDLVNWILAEQRETIRHLEAYIAGTPA